MDILKTKTAQSSHIVFNFVYSLLTCVYEYTGVEWPHASDE